MTLAVGGMLNTYTIQPQHLLSMLLSPLNILLFSHRLQPQEMYADSKRVDQPVHQCFLINTFLICSLESIISKVVTCQFGYYSYLLQLEDWPQGYKTFSMLNSAEQEISPAHKC